MSAGAVINNEICNPFSLVERCNTAQHFTFFTLISQPRHSHANWEEADGRGNIQCFCMWLKSQKQIDSGGKKYRKEKTEAEVCESKRIISQFKIDLR